MSDKELTAEEVQATLDAVKAKQKPAEGEVQPAVTKYTCPDCGDEFEIEDGMFPTPTQGSHVWTGMVCKQCWINQRNQFFAPRHQDVRRPNSILGNLNSLGVNVRRHGHLKLELLSEGPAKTAADEFIASVAKAGDWGEVTGLYIWGPTGTGKSQLAVCVLRQLIEMGVVHPQGVVYDRARSMVTQLQDRYTTGRVDEFSQRRAKAKLWVYEDAGTEKLTADAFRVVEDIFDRREGHPTIITSNLDRPKLVEHWKGTSPIDRFRSRLAPYVPIQLTGKDKRIG